MSGQQSASEFLSNYSEPVIAGWPNATCRRTAPKDVEVRMFHRPALVRRDNQGQPYIRMVPFGNQTLLDSIIDFLGELDEEQPPLAIPPVVQRYIDAIQAFQDEDHQADHHEDSMLATWMNQNSLLADIVLQSKVFSPPTLSGTRKPRPSLRFHQWVSLLRQPGSQTVTKAELDGCITRKTGEMCHTHHTVLANFDAKAGCAVPPRAYKLLCLLHDHKIPVQVYLHQGKELRFVYTMPPNCTHEDKPWLDMILARMFRCAAYAQEMRTAFTPLFAGGPFALGGVVPDEEGKLAVGFTRPIGPLDNGEVLELEGWTHRPGYPSLLLVLLALAADKVKAMRLQEDELGYKENITSTDDDYVLDGWTTVVEASSEAAKSQT